VASGSATAVAVGDRVQPWQWRIFAANYLGLVFEAYDLTIYSLLVVTVSAYFHVPAWYGFLVLSMTYVLRGAGGLAFGHVADKIGRRNALVVTVLGYSLATGLTGLSWNVISLLVFRALAGLFIGGEYVGYSYTMEAVPGRRRGSFSGLIVSSYSLGFLLASATFGVVSFAMGPHFASGAGWRWPFFVGIVPALIALWLRLGVEESPAWQRARASGRARPRVPLLEIFKRRYLARTIYCWLVMAALIWAYDVLALAQPTMLHLLKVSNGQISQLAIITNVGSMVAAVLGGVLSQRIGRKRALLAVALLGVPASFVFAPFWMLPAAPSYAYLAGSGLLGVIVAEAGFGVMPAYLSERYPTAVRATGATGTYNLGQIIAGWSLTLLAATYGGSARSFMLGMVVNAGIGFVVLFALVAFGRETRGVDLVAYSGEDVPAGAPGLSAPSLGAGSG
jgi:SHS family lactate transporter-like MFS transporter